MNNKAFRNIISFYKENFDKIEEHELYKWKAVQNFQNNWDIDADDFVNMLKISLKGTSNLLSAGNYYPRKMIIWMAEKNSKAVQEMFKNLYDLDIDFEERLENFKSRAKYLIEKYKENNVHNHYQDDRAIMVYLSLRYPEKYYLYKYTMFKDFVERTDYDDTPKSGRIETLFKFKSLCDYIHNYVMHDDELLEMYEPRRKKYYDPEYHLLVQDIIYTTYYEKEPEILETTETISLVEPIEFTQSAIKKPVLLKSSFIDYIEKEKNQKGLVIWGNSLYFFRKRKSKKIKTFKR